jgi:hypothetical protein
MPETVVKANGSWIGDIRDEWDKLPTWGKIAAAGVLVVVAYLAWRARAASSSAQNAAASTAGAATTGTQSPFPMVGNLPVLPNNVNPVFDSTGNPIAYQQGPPPPTSTGITGLFGLAAPVSVFNVKNPPQTYKGPNGVTYKLNYGGTGANGQQRIWGTPTTGGQGVLLYGQGGGGMSMEAFMQNPWVYFVSAEPHVTNAGRS